MSTSPSQVQTEKAKKAKTKLAAIFAEDGALSQIVPGYEVRKEQWALAERILESLYGERALLAEAPTGTGKSFAYLVAAALYALLEERIVVVSTQTLTLQAQLLGKDLPVVAEALKRVGYADFRYELAKGRAHYVCLRRFDVFAERSMREGGALRRLAERLNEAVYQELERSGEGERKALPVSVPNDVWAEIAGDAEDCHQKHSPHYDHCFIQQARRRWGKAHIVVANHALVFADLALRTEGESGVLPKYARIIFDEGHHVAETATRFFATKVSVDRVEGWWRDIERRRQSWMEGVFTPEVLEELRPLFERFTSALEEAFIAIDDYVSAVSGEGLGLQSITRTIEAPIAVPTGYRQAAANLSAYLEKLAALETREEPEVRGLRRLIGKIESASMLLDRACLRTDAVDYAYWIERAVPDGAGWVDLALPAVRARWLTVHAEPIDAGAVLAPLFEEVPPVLVSATLFPGMADDQSRTYVAETLGLAPDAFDAFVTESPFDYASRALYVFSRTAPDPRDEPAFLDFVAEALKRVLSVTRGRTLALFTNFTHIRAVAERLQAWAKTSDIELLVHTKDADRDALIDRFRAGSSTVLLGNETFWEGIDVPGDGLVCVVVTKLPFANPGDPRTRARERALRAAGKDAFATLYLPQAMLRLKQGVGRLIRTKHDRGVVVFLDSRLVHKGYGRKIIAALPPARIGTLKEIADYVSQR
ncbi:MAG: ATP-dependent DNA helicase [Hydrogenibacillus sp.]|nr:ATP-dependent DNA helicase [Hydrogenibacillus sp.]